MPVWISRSGKCPWRTIRRRPAESVRCAYASTKPATSASTACPSKRRAPRRKTSVSGSSSNDPGWRSWTTVSSLMAYPSFVENGDSNIARIRRPHLIPSPQLSGIAHGPPVDWQAMVPGTQPYMGNSRPGRGGPAHRSGAAIGSRPASSWGNASMPSRCRRAPYFAMPIHRWCWCWKIACARRRRITIDKADSVEAAVRDGLSQGSRVVFHPNDRVVDDSRIARRVTTPGPIALRRSMGTREPTMRG